MSAIKPSVSIIDDKKKLFGLFEIKEQRLTFQDPFGKLLTHQVKRWRPEKNQVKADSVGEKGLILGIKIHSKAMYILSQVLYYLSFGFINKSIAVVINNKTIYLSNGSLQKWRRLNHEALLSLGILKSASRKDVAKVRQVELNDLIQLLRTPHSDRPERKKTIEECSDFFELASTALRIAEAKVSASSFPNVKPDKLCDATYAIAAFHILLKSEITDSDACGYELLKVGKDLNVQNFGASQEELARLFNEGKENLENSIAVLDKRVVELEKQGLDTKLAKKQERKARLDLVLFETIRVVYEETQDGIKQRFFNKTPDLFSSLQTRNCPIQTKKLLIDIMRNNEKFALGFTSKLLDHFVNGKPVPGRSTQESEFALQVISLGKALKEQFAPSDPGLLLKKIFTNSIVKLSSIINETNFCNENLLFQVGTSAAWDLLKSPSTITTHPDGSKTLTCTIEEPQTISIYTPSNNFYDDQDCTKTSPYPFVNALAGKLTCEDRKTPECYQEVFEIVREYKERLFEEEVIVLDEMVKRLTLNVPEGEKGHKTFKIIVEEIFGELDPNQYTPTELSKNFFNARQSRLSQYEDAYYLSDAYDPEAFQNIVSMYKKLEKLGKLIYYRYLTRFLVEFGDKIDFQENGTITIDPSLLDSTPLIRRTQEEHKTMIATYFPDYTIPQYPKKQLPQFKTNEHLKLYPTDYLTTLFTMLTNEVHLTGTSGSCCVGALAQGILKNKAASGKQANITAIRKAAGNYMRNHPEQFFESGLLDTSTSIYESRYSELSLIKNPNEQQKNELKQLKINKIFEYSNSIQGSDYFGLPAIKAISFIIGRPIYVVAQNIGHLPYNRDINTGSIEMQKINPQLDGEILYLHHNDVHYHCLTPLRVGTEKI